eukprot:TRINITY_DN2505_c0_g1_i1.p2 TRINITY_DN2505_c0_g1~~TRINITY_DN2505_c0_g1_i1.p2  ORF type:complete len:95 (-),score=8.73 TRINITY_DN2505_c0_g1_i1:220-504(-)
MRRKRRYDAMIICNLEKHNILLKFMLQLINSFCVVLKSDESWGLNADSTANTMTRDRSWATSIHRDCFANTTRCHISEDQAIMVSNQARGERET